MNDNQALEIINKIFSIVFNQENKFTLKEILEKFAFDVKLPKQVNDSTTNEITWADAISSGKFITLENMEKRDNSIGWILPKQEVHNLDDILKIWNTINLTTTERVYESVNVSKSDTIYRCENIYHSTDCSDSKNLIYCDSCTTSEFLLASQRTSSSLICIKTDDSKDCSNCYHVICSNKISNSLFIQDCFNLDECIFCSHISNKRYCIANMQFDSNEYFIIKEAIINWILYS